MRIDEMLFRLGLRLYPKDFHQDFSDEMVDTYRARRSDTFSSMGKLWIILQEMLDIFPNALMLHYDAYRTLPHRHKSLVQARWIIRISSLLLTWFFVSVTWESYSAQPKAENLVMIVLFSLQMVCVVFALKWERIGAIIMLTTTITISFIMFLGLLIPNYEYLALLGTIFWATPFIGFAFGFFMIGHKRFQLQQQASS